ncbi:hypothetical protein Tco_0206300 [Tanacetum coccineum]
MMVPAQHEQGEGFENSTDPHHTPTITQPSSSQPQKKQKLRKPRKDTKVPQPSDPTTNVAEEAVNEEDVPTHSNDPLLSGEDRLKLEELMALCTNLQNRVLDLEHTKTTQALEIESLKRRVKKLEKKQRSRTYKLKRLYKVGLSAKVVSSKDKGLGEEDASKQGRKIHDIDADEDITLDSTHFDMILYVRVHDLLCTILVSAAKDLSDVDMSLAQALAELKNAKPKEQAPTPTPIVSSLQSSQVKDKVQFDKEARIAREKEKANAALITQWNDIQDKVETDYELAQRMQQEEQEELIDAEKATLFVQLLEKRKKHFAAKRT